MQIHTPDWVKKAIFYQIFPDRFAKRSIKISDVSNHDRLNFESWQSVPTPHGYKGGNLGGVTDQLNYLKDLGITAIYFTPIFQSACNHRYHTFNYYEVDPLLGGNKVFFEFLEAAHKMNIKVVLDGVFNHVGRGFFAFHDVIENEEKSPWLSWFNIKHFPLNAYTKDRDKEPANYSCWWNLPPLPNLNHENPDVREYIMRVAEHWVRLGIDGWRLDVPEMIKVPGFWQEFRDRVKAINPEAYIVGEIWTDARSWLDGTQFDGVMNYLFTKAVLSFLGHAHLDRTVLHDHFRDLKLTDAKGYAENIEHIVKLYPKEILQTQLNLINSHDTARFISTMKGSTEAAKLGAVLLLTFPGAPCIYYGDEVGLKGHADPDCRRTFPEEKHWNQDLLKTYKELIKLRLTSSSLYKGDYQTLATEDHTYTFARIHNEEPHSSLIISVNNSKNQSTINLNIEKLTFLSPQRVGELKVKFGEGSFSIQPSGLQIKLPSWGSIIIGY